MCFNKVTSAQLRLYFKNFILCGEIDYHCMLCSESFTKLYDIDIHIKEPFHKNAKNTVSYVPRLKKDYIYKIGLYYYCMLCNFADTQIEEVQSHIQSIEHLKIKHDPKLSGTNKLALDRTLPEYSENNSCVKFEKLTMSLEDWHGIRNGYCTICNLPIKCDDDDEHVTKTSHMLNLTNCATVGVEMGVEDKYRRLITKDLVYCFKCKVTIPLQMIKSHWKHKHVPLKKKESTNARSKKFFEVDLENDKATCIFCHEVLDYRFETLYDHKKLHFDPNYDRNEDEIDEDLRPFTFGDSGKTRKELKEYGKQYSIVLNSGGSKGYCNLCDIFISACKLNFKQHVVGRLHTTHLELRGLKPKPKNPDYEEVMETQPFVKVMTSVRMRDSAVVWINNEFCIDIYSFMFLTQISDPNKMKCYLCDVVLSSDDKEHVDVESEHVRKLVLVKTVILPYNDELVREIRPHVYHCGYCNKIYPGWIMLRKHFTTYPHYMQKELCKERAKEKRDPLEGHGQFSIVKGKLVS